jgi:hypothetical protein
MARKFAAITETMRSAFFMGGRFQKWQNSLAKARN